MRASNAVLLVALAAPVGCASGTPDVVVHNRLAGIAGEKAFDCGRATTKEQYAEHTACAEDALRRKSPFFVQYKGRGIDAESEEGLALNAKGKLFSVYTISWSPLYRGRPSGKLELSACDANTMRTLRDGELTC
jgi:hypothetical protein